MVICFHGTYRPHKPKSSAQHMQGQVRNSELPVFRPSFVYPVEDESHQVFDDEENEKDDDFSTNRIKDKR